MSEPIDHQNPAPKPEAPSEKTFTQAEVDAQIEKRLAKAMKDVPSKEELTAFRAWKESQQTERERWNNLTRERDESRTALTTAQAELEQLRREKLLLNQGIPAEDVDYYAFKIGKLVSDSKTFEQAAEEYLKANEPGGKVRVDMTARLGGGGQPTANDTMNALIRGARK